MRCYVFLLFLLCACRPVAGQGGGGVDYGPLAPRIRAFSEADYGAENQNWDVTQSPEGVLYVANSGGVLRFDGLNWTVHQLPARPTVRTVAWAHDRLYVGGYGEFGYFRHRAGQLGEYVSLSARLPSGKRGEEIWNIAALDDGTVAFQSFSHLYWLVGDSLRTEQPGSLMFAHAAGDRLLLPVTGRGVVQLRPDAAAVVLPGSDPAGRQITGLATAAQGLLLATEERVYRYRDGALQPWSAAADRLLAGQQINRLAVLRNGDVAVGTIVSGVYVFDAGGTLRYRLGYGDGLGNNTVLALYEDHAGNLWTGLDRGLALIVRSEPLRFYRSGDRPVGAAYAAAAYGGIFYLGTNQGLFRYDTVAARYTLLPGTEGQVWELRPTPFGLLCGHNGGTFLVNGEQARKVSDRAGGWQSIDLDGDGRRWLQANYVGLSLLELGADAGAESRLKGMLAPLRYLARTGGREVLALHGARGAFRLAISEPWDSITAVDTIRRPDLIRPLLARFGDTLLVQTDEGIYRYQDDSLRPLAEFRGYRPPPAEYLLPGQPGGDTWFVAGPDRLTVYRGHRRLVAYPVRLRRGYPFLTGLDDGAYLLGLEDGFAVYRGDSVPTPRPAMLLELNDGDGVTRLPYARNNPRFTFALPVLDRQVRYRYRLLGFEEGWSEWSERGEREYTNLEEGKYRFVVQSDWYDVERDISFTVLPPWYRTGWAYLAYVLLSLAGAYLLYRGHQQQLRQQARKLEAIRQRQLQRQRIEARNETLEAENLRKSRELANTTLALAKKKEMLLDLRDELGKTAASDRLRHLIDRNLDHEEDWAIFESHFNEVHEEFLQRLRTAHPELTSGDLRLAAYVKMDLSSKEIAPLLHISVRGVENKRYRLRKKMGLESNDHLGQYLQEL